MEIKDQKERLFKVKIKKRKRVRKTPKIESINERRIRKFLNRQVRNNKESHETLKR